MTEDAAQFYDGLTARRRAAGVALDGDGVTVTDGGGEILTRWPYADLRRQDAPAGRLRLSATGAPELARLEIADPALAEEILRRCPHIHTAARADRKGKAAVVFWSMAAAISLILTAIYLVPHLAERLTPLVPVAFERRLGDAVDNQVRVIFGNEVCATPEGDAALATLHAKLTNGAILPMPVEIAVLRSRQPNAIALPGGRVYVLSGLLDRAQDVNEVAGVLAHEIGHVAHRDGLRQLLQSSATSFLIGLLFGDMLGGGTLVMLGRTLVDSAYSRDAETAADAFAAERMLAQGHSPAPMADLLARLMKEFGGENKTLTIFSSHPLSEDRKRALSRREPAFQGAPLLSEAAWQALKTICGANKGEGKDAAANSPTPKPAP